MYKIEQRNKKIRTRMRELAFLFGKLLISFLITKITNSSILIGLKKLLFPL